MIEIFFGGRGESWAFFLRGGGEASTPQIPKVESWLPNKIWISENLFGVVGLSVSFLIKETKQNKAKNKQNTRSETEKPAPC